LNVIPKPLDKVTKEDIESLMQNRVAEGREVEYKSVLPSGADGDKKDFMADVSSFANAAGGEIYYGVTEAGGVPTAIDGLVIADRDAELQRLDNMLRDGIDPRLPGVEMQFVDGFVAGPVLVIRIPKSWMSPHMVKYQNWSRFHSRNNSGKYLLDTAELRSAFSLAEALPEKIKRFRDERLSQIMARQTPVVLVDRPCLVLHLLPVSSFGRHDEIPVGKLPRLQPIGSYHWDRRVNIDGVLTFSNQQGNVPGSPDYCQVYRSGRIEAVYADIVQDQGDAGYITSRLYEVKLVDAVRSYLTAMKDMGIGLPVFISMCILGAKGAKMYASGAVFAIDRPILVLPDRLLEEYDADVPKLMKPIFDSVWNACGFEHSFNYTEGRWNPQY
jgi:hypothetical protein